jgi:L-rhamnonate dehydratase
MKAIETKAEKALALGFRAIKIEMLFEEASDTALAAAIADARRIVGDDVVLMIDFGYRWRDWQAARKTLNRIAQHDIYFAEAPLQHDDLHGHAKLSAVSPIRICGGEWAVTRWEIRDWITIGNVSVVQPDPSRCGGFTEMRRIADLCEMHGVQCVPHAWRTPILTMACIHLQAACPNVPYIEFMEPRLYPSPLSDDLFSQNVAVQNGVIPLPMLHGLGLEVSDDYLARYLRTN